MLQSVLASVVAVPLRWAVRGLTSLHSLRPSLQPSLHADKWPRSADGLSQEREREGSTGSSSSHGWLRYESNYSRSDRWRRKKKLRERKKGRVRANSMPHALLLNSPVMKKATAPGDGEMEEWERWEEVREWKQPLVFSPGAWTRDLWLTVGFLLPCCSRFGWVFRKISEEKKKDVRNTPTRSNGDT